MPEMKPSTSGSLIHPFIYLFWVTSLLGGFASEKAPIPCWHSSHQLQSCGYQDVNFIFFLCFALSSLPVSRNEAFNISGGQMEPQGPSAAVSQQSLALGCFPSFIPLRAIKIILVFSSGDFYLNCDQTSKTCQIWILNSIKHMLAWYTWDATLII